MMSSFIDFRTFNWIDNNKFIDDVHIIIEKYLIYQHHIHSSVEKIRIMLFTVVLLILVGVACASEVSDDIADVSSVTQKADTHSTYKVADTTNSKDNKIYENVQNSESSKNNLDKNNSKTIDKNRNPNVKTAPTIKNWDKLKSAVNGATGKEITLKLKKSTYKNNGVIRWENVNTKTYN